MGPEVGVVVTQQPQHIQGVKGVEMRVDQGAFAHLR
jgi:hypothetical protein